MLPDTMLVERDHIARERIRPLTRAEYDRLVELEMFAEDERIELLRGALVRMSPQKPPHAGAIEELCVRLQAALGDRARVRCQLPFAATDDSEPEPDIAVVDPVPHRRVHPSQAHLIAEVAYTSADIDLGVKIGVYAQAVVPEYWVVNLPDDVIEVFTEPTSDGYRNHRRFVRGERLRLVAFPDVEIEVDAILPPR